MECRDLCIHSLPPLRETGQYLHFTRDGRRHSRSLGVNVIAFLTNYEEDLEFGGNV